MAYALEEVTEISAALSTVEDEHKDASGIAKQPPPAHYELWNHFYHEPIASNVTAKEELKNAGWFQRLTSSSSSVMDEARLEEETRSSMRFAMSSIRARGKVCALMQITLDHFDYMVV